MRSFYTFFTYKSHENEIPKMTITFFLMDQFANHENPEYFMTSIADFDGHFHFLENTETHIEETTYALKK